MSLKISRQKLPNNYFQSSDVLQLAQDLLGKILYTNFNNQLTSGIIVETEAYRGIHDRASHAYKNKRSSKNESMYHSGGIIYVYRCYGIHNLLNIVTNIKDIPDAILIRAIEPVDGLEIMKLRTGKNLSLDIGSGPGKLSKALGITLTMDGKNLNNNSIWIENNALEEKVNIIKKPRVGISYAKEDSKLLWRFYIKNNQYISKE